MTRSNPLSSRCLPAAHFRFIYEFIKTWNRSRARENTQNRDRRGFLNILLRVSGLFACKKVLEKKKKKTFQASRKEVTDLFVRSLLISTHHVKRIKYLFMQKRCCFMCTFIKISYRLLCRSVDVSAVRIQSSRNFPQQTFPEQ